MVLGICTRYAALGAAAVLAIAVYALQVVKGFGWTWNTGGYEYPVFWAIVCIAVALEEWKAFCNRVMSFSPVTPAAPVNQAADEQNATDEFMERIRFAEASGGWPARPTDPIAPSLPVNGCTPTEDGHQTRAPLPDIRSLNGRVPVN